MFVSISVMADNYPADIIFVTCMNKQSYLGRGNYSLKDLRFVLVFFSEGPSSSQEAQ